MRVRCGAMPSGEIAPSLEDEDEVEVAGENEGEGLFSLVGGYGSDQGGGKVGMVDGDKDGDTGDGDGDSAGAAGDKPRLSSEERRASTCFLRRIRVG